MKSTFKHEDLQAALNHLKQAVLSRPTLPVLTHILLQVEKNKATMTTSDLNMTIVYKMACESEDEFSLLIPFNELKSIAGVVYGDITIQNKRNRAIVSCQQDEFDLGLQDKPEDFPKLPAKPKGKAIELTGSFHDFLSRAVLTVGKDELSPAITHVCLDIQKNRLSIVSTDKNQLFCKHLEIESDVEEQVLISAKVAKALEGFNTCKFSFIKNIVAFENDNIVVMATRLDDKYPNYRALLPATIEFNTEAHFENLKVAIEKAWVINTLDNQTSFKMSAECMQLENNDDVSSRKVKTPIPCKYSGTLEEISLGANRFKICLQQLKGNDEVKLSISEKMCIMSPATDESLIVLLGTMSKK